MYSFSDEKYPRTHPPLMAGATIQYLQAKIKVNTANEVSRHIQLTIGQDTQSIFKCDMILAINLSGKTGSSTGWNRVQLVCWVIDELQSTTDKTWMMQPLTITVCSATSPVTSHHATSGQAHGNTTYSSQLLTHCQQYQGQEGESGEREQFSKLQTNRDYTHGSYVARSDETKQEEEGEDSIYYKKPARR